MHVHSCWDYILNQDQSLRPLVDVETVRLLETLNPRASIRDENTIEIWMIQGKLFPRVVDSLVRKGILDRLKQFDRMIPSLHTFLEDTKWLEPCVKIIRSLLPSGCRDPTRESIFKMYNGSNILRVQDSSMTFTEYEGSEVRNVEYGYRQLWLFAWRHFPELSGVMPRKDNGEPKPQPKASNEQCRYQFAQLASTLGFQSSVITAVQERDPDTVMALDFLREARPEEFFRLQESVRSTLAGLICQVLPSVGAKNAITRERLDIMQDVLIPTDHRCGRPHEQSHSYSKSYFFLEDIYAERTQRLSYYTVNRDIFLAFFGTMPPWKPSNDEMDQDSEPQLNSRVNLADRMDTNLQVNNSFAGPSVTSTSLSQCRTLNTNAIVPVLSVEPVMSTNNTIFQHNELVASTPFPQIGPADTSSLALVPAVTTRKRGVEQYRAPGGKFIRQIGAVNEIVDGSDMGSQLVPREATEKPTLYATWKSQCKNGDKFLVEASNLAYLNVHSGESTPLDALKMFSSCCALAWSPYRNQLVSVTPEALDRYACSTTADGIIYFFERMTSDRRLKLITGETTERRLHQLEETLLLTEPLAEPPEVEL